MKDSLWSMDLFRCASATLRSHWVLVVMDQYTRRIIGFGVHAGKVDGGALCRMFNRAIRGQRGMPKYLSSDSRPRNKLLDFMTYFNNYRTHTSREGRTPDTPVSRPIANLPSFRWRSLSRPISDAHGCLTFQCSGSLPYAVNLCKNLE
jgi:putative transposase